MSVDIEIISVIGANGQPLPLHGNSIGSNWSGHVKQERPDDAEIQELAAKMKEAQKDALAKQQLQAAQLANRQAMANGVGLQPPVNNGGQTNILNYLNRQRPNNVANANTNGSVTTNGRPPSTDDNKKPPCDEESQKGRFGWTTLGKTYIPYIFRASEKYCSVRMVENKLLNKYLHCLHSDIYSSCTCVRSYYITQAEAALLHDINSKHCDCEFTKEIFTQKDLIVRLSDATKFYQFLDICYRKLISGSKSPSEKCGFIRINKDSVVPYTVRNGEQVVPLFYFEGETENLKQKADLLSGWDLAYLKFCCKVQGIRNELFSSENVAVISLTDIKSYFPNGTEFEDYWPSKVVDSNLLIGNRSNSNNTVNWTRQPSQPPPKSLPPSGLGQKGQHASASAAHQAAAAVRQPEFRPSADAISLENFNYAAFRSLLRPGQSALLQQPTTAQRLHPNAALAQATVQALTNGSLMSQPQNNLPLLHPQMLASQAQQTHAANNRNQYRTPMENMLLNNRQQYAAYNNAAISMQPVSNHGQSNAPPPLVRSAGGQNANHMSSVEQTLLHQQQQQTQLQQQRPSTQQQQQQRHINVKLNINMKSLLSSPTSMSSPKMSPMISPSTPTGGNSAAAAAAAATSAALLTNNFNLAPSAPSTPQDYNNLALWNQLTPSQRLLLTQQFKNTGSFLGANAKPTFPSLPSLPLDTDLITMLDYNPNKVKGSGANSTNAHSMGQSYHHSNLTMSPRTNGQFTKPHVPPLIPVNSFDANSQRKSNRMPGSSSTVPLNSSAALEDFEKKFKMNDEMRAVVQKVLSNPDLSTFIQTNTSNTFVPFMSPPMSPANGGHANNSTSVSIVPNPHVTITPQLPAHFNHNNAAHSPSASSASSTSSLTGSGSVSRQKSVICSTGVSMLTSPAGSSCNSSASHSPSPNRTKSTYAYNQSQHQQQLSSSTPTTPMEVIDLSSPRRSLQAASVYLQQQQQQQQQQQAAVVAAAQQQQQQQAQQHRLAAAAAAAAAAAHHSQPNGRNASAQGTGSNNSNNNNSASMHLQRHAALAAAAAAASESTQRLSIIPEIPANNLNVQPYKMQKVFVENHLVPCINMKAYNDSEQLMTLTDFQKYFFPNVPLDQCKFLIETLDVELYRGNRRQVQVLMEHDRSQNENIPLVQVRDVIKYMTQLTFMIRNNTQPPNKRSRISELSWGGQHITTTTTTATSSSTSAAAITANAIAALHEHQQQLQHQQSSQKHQQQHTHNTHSSDNNNIPRIPLAPPPPHPLDMLYSQHSRQHQQQQQQHVLQQQHQQHLLNSNHIMEKSNQSKSSSSSSLSSSSATSSHKTHGASSSSATSLRTTTTAQQLAAAAAESAAAYYTAAAAAAAASMLNPALNATSAAVNPFANPLDWLGACNGQKRSSSNVQSATVNNSSRTAANGNTNSTATTDFMSMFSSHNSAHTHANVNESALHQRSSSNASSSSMASSSSLGGNNGHHKTSSAAQTTATTGTGNSSVATGASASSSLAAHAAAASALFGTVAPFSAPSLVNPYPHLAHGAHSLPSPTIYPPTPPPSAPWIHPWYAGDTF
ncbi:LOW QUALITY PROTEIN: uncharacterized protein ACN2A1_011796 [Glossina fuscipes fuscipes]